MAADEGLARQILHASMRTRAARQQAPCAKALLPICARWAAWWLSSFLATVCGWRGGGGHSTDTLTNFLTFVTFSPSISSSLRTWCLRGTLGQSFAEQQDMLANVYRRHLPLLPACVRYGVESLLSDDIFARPCTQDILHSRYVCLGRGGVSKVLFTLLLIAAFVCLHRLPCPTLVTPTYFPLLHRFMEAINSSSVLDHVKVSGKGGGERERREATARLSTFPPHLQVTRDFLSELLYIPVEGFEITLPIIAPQFSVGRVPSGVLITKKNARN